MSWVCVDGIGPEALHGALDLSPAGEIPDLWDLDLSDAPWAGAPLKFGWGAVFALYEAAVDLPILRLPTHWGCFVCVVMEIVTISQASLWQGGRKIWRGICRRSSPPSATLRRRSRGPARLSG
jgi:hypothetical protein